MRSSFKSFSSSFSSSSSQAKAPEDRRTPRRWRARFATAGANVACDFIVATAPHGTAATDEPQGCGPRPSSGALARQRTQPPGEQVHGLKAPESPGVKSPSSSSSSNAGTDYDDENEEEEEEEMGATYHPEHFEPLFAAEDRHFWFRSRSRCIAAATRLIPNRAELTDVLEHGCGTGYVLSGLPRLFPRARVVGADLFAEGLKLARHRFAGPLIQTDLVHCGFRPALDFIGLFDVLEHLDDDLQVLRSLWSQLRPGGWLLLTVPAHMALWSEYDVASGHRRRYAIPQLETRLREAGFAIEYTTQFMLPLLPLMWLRRRISWGRNGDRHQEARSSVEKELQVNPLVSRVLELILRPEPRWIARRRRLPCGTSLLALARRTPC